MSKLLGLHEVEINSRARVVKIVAEGRMRKRIMDMGIVSGTEILVEGRAPMGDPIEIQVRGYKLTLRKSEAKDIIVELV